jgi:hypothetical protein
LRIDALAHDTLQTHARANQSQTSVRICVGPRRHGTRRGDAPLSALPERDRGCHREERLDNRAQEQPQARLWTNAVTDTANEGAKDKGDQGCEGLFVCEVERCVAMARRTLKEAREREGKL